MIIICLSNQTVEYKIYLIKEDIFPIYTSFYKTLQDSIRTDSMLFTHSFPEFKSDYMKFTKSIPTLISTLTGLKTDHFSRHGDKLCD